MRKAVLAGSLLAGLIFTGSAGIAAAETPVPPGSPGDENGNGILDTSERPDNPDVGTVSAPAAARPPVGNETPVPPGSPGDEDGDGILDTTEQPDNPDA